MRKHFAFVSIPTHGHVNPTLPLVAELTRRGHRVSYATGEAFHVQVRAAGAEPVLAPFKVPEPPPAGGARPDPAAMRERTGWFVDSITGVLPVLCDHYGTHRPDVFCGDMMSPVTLFAAQKLAVPFVSTYSTHARNERFSLRGNLKRAPEVPEQLRAAFDEFTGRMRTLATTHGIPADFDFFNYVAELNLVFLPREFQLAGETFDDRFVFLGPSVRGRTDPDQWHSPGHPLLFISLGTVFNARPDFYRQCIEAFGDSDWKVAMAIGRHTDRAQLGPIPANFEVRERFPQLVVLSAADAFISHSGMNSTMEAMYFGVPLISVPQQPEQEKNARRTEELGFGKRLKQVGLTPETIRETVTQVAADEMIRANLAQISAKLRAQDGAALGAEALEAHIGYKK